MTRLEKGNERIRLAPSMDTWMALDEKRDWFLTDLGTFETETDAIRKLEAEGWREAA